MTLLLMRPLNVSTQTNQPALSHCQNALQHLRASYGYRLTRTLNKADAAFQHTQMGAAEIELVNAIIALGGSQ